MKCVADTSAISWLGRVDYLWLLKESYEGVYAPESVFKELESHYQTKEFVKNNLEKIILTEQDNERFIVLTDKVFISYYFFTDADEALYANCDAVNVFGAYGGTRDIIGLCRLAEQGGIFTRKESISYLQRLQEKRFRPKHIQKLLESFKIYS